MDSNCSLPSRENSSGPAIARVANARLSALCAAALMLLGAISPTLVTAQSQQRDAVSVSSVHRPLVRSSDMIPIGAAVAGVGILMAADKSIERSFQRRSVQSSASLRNLFRTAGALGDPGSIVFSAATYFAGLAVHSRPVAALGMYTGEAVVLGGVLSESLKGIGGRSRPRIDSTHVHNFNPGKGFSNDDYGSFPSAETTIAFAAATAASRFSSRQWPGASRYVTPAAYGAATLVGASRLYKNEHWASDVAAGAAVGIIAGVGFDRWNLAHPDNIWERIFLPKSVTPARHGATLRWSVATE